MQTLSRSEVFLEEMYKVTETDGTGETLCGLVSSSFTNIPITPDFEIPMMVPIIDSSEDEVVETSGGSILIRGLYFIETISGAQCTREKMISLSSNLELGELLWSNFNSFKEDQGGETDEIFKKVVLSYISCEISDNLGQEWRREMLPEGLLFLLKRTWVGFSEPSVEDREYNAEVIYMYLNLIYDKSRLLNSKFVC